MSWKRGLLWIVWGLSFLIAAAALAIFVQGVLRDTRAGEPRLAIDLAAAHDWRATRFSLWGAGRHRLSLSSVNHEPRHVGARLNAEFEVALVDADGKPVLERRYAAGASGLALPQNYADAPLETLSLEDWPWRRWTLKARVLAPDPRFASARSEIRLFEERYDPGMGGMINYVMIVPAGLFLLIAFATALPLAAGGARLPLALSGACAVALALALALL